MANEATVVEIKDVEVQVVYEEDDDSVNVYIDPPRDHPSEFTVRVFIRDDQVFVGA